MKDKELIKIYEHLERGIILEQYTQMSPEEREQAYKVVYQAIRNFKHEDPFMYEYIMRWLSVRDLKASMVNEADTNCPTMQTNGPTLTWNPGFVKDILKYNIRFVQAVLVHEVLHVLFNHHKRFSFVKDPNIWKNVVNIATDLSINQMIQKTKIKLPEDIGLIFLDHPIFKEMFANDPLPPDKDAVYYFNRIMEKLKNKPQEQQEPEEQNGNQGQESDESEDSSDDSGDEKVEDSDSGDDSNDTSTDTENDGQDSDNVDGEGDESGYEATDDAEGSGSGEDNAPNGEESGQGSGSGESSDESEDGDSTGSGSRKGQSTKPQFGGKGEQPSDTGEQTLNYPQGWEELVKQAEKAGEIKPDTQGDNTEDGIRDAEQENKELLDKVAPMMGGGIGQGATGYGGLKYDFNKLASPRTIPWEDILRRFANNAQPEKTYAKIPRRRFSGFEKLLSKESNIIRFKDFALLENDDKIIRKGRGINKVAELCFIVDVSGSMGSTWRTIFKQLKDVFDPQTLSISQEVIIRVLIFSDGLQQELIFTQRGREGLQGYGSGESLIESILPGKFVPLKNVYELPINPDLIRDVKIRSGGGTQLKPLLDNLRDRNPIVQMAIVITDGYLFGSDVAITETRYPYDLIWFITSAPQYISDPFKTYFETNETYWLQDYDLDLTS